jgi:hypothetical protein
VHLSLQVPMENSQGKCGFKTTGVQILSFHELVFVSLLYTGHCTGVGGSKVNTTDVLSVLEETMYQK